MHSRLFPFWAALLSGCSLLLFPSCDDSSTVGLGVGPDSLEGGEARRVEVTPALDTTRHPPVTGLQFQPGNQTWRFLTGRVNDPLTGTIEADAYIDVLGRTRLPSNIFSAESSELAAQLRFTTSYLHGDTTSTVQVRLRDLAEEADMHQARADTTFPAESETITTASISPTDSLVTVDLPQAWIDEHLTTLRDTSDQGGAFQESFHGFKLEAAGGNAVVGFSATTPTLRLTYTPDSVSADYAVFKTFTHVDRPPTGTTPDVPDNHILLQDGVGTSLRMEWNFDENPLDSLRNTPLNAAEIYVPIDTTALKERSGPESFVRPLPRGYRLVVQQDDAIQPVVLSPGALPGLVYALNRAPSGVRNPGLFPFFEQSLLRTEVYSTYRLQVADRSSLPEEAGPTLNPGLPSTLPTLIPLAEAEHSAGAPRAVLIVTPL